MDAVRFSVDVVAGEILARVLSQAAAPIKPLVVEPERMARILFYTKSHE